jgi:predicted AAA+ superfamily ATPase
VRDSGIYHQLLNIQTYEQLMLNTHLGFSWEAFALEEITKSLNLRNEECYFWATHQEAELDLFVIINGKRIGFEFKTHDQPSITKSMRIATETLKLEHLYIVTPNEKSFPLENKVSVLSLKDAAKLVL